MPPGDSKAAAAMPSPRSAATCSHPRSRLTSKARSRRSDHRRRNSVVRRPVHAAEP
jgi:hypothetical protein